MYELRSSLVEKDSSFETDLPLMSFEDRVSYSIKNIEDLSPKISLLNIPGDEI